MVETMKKMKWNYVTLENPLQVVELLESLEPNVALGAKVIFSESRYRIWHA